MFIVKRFSFVLIVLLVAGCSLETGQETASVSGVNISLVDNPGQANTTTTGINTTTGSNTTTAVTNIPTTATCPTENFIDVQPDPANSEYPDPYLNVYCEGNTMYIESNSIPNFEFVQITPNPLNAVNVVYEIPLTPQEADQPADIPLLGSIGVAVNGLPIVGPNEAGDLGWGDPYVDGILDFCNGHTAMTYHFHAPPTCLFTDWEGNTALVVGYAFDGYPILAPYSCEDAACTSIKEVQSSWQRTQDVEAAWDAHEYIAGSGDLDQCNGLEDANGNYAYFATETFPYFLACYHGTPSNSAGAGNGNGANNQAQNGAANGAPQGGGLDLAAAATRLGITEPELRQALGAPPPDFAAAAARLSITEQELINALNIGGNGGPPAAG